MNLFVENLEKIRPIAEKIVSTNRDKFDVDELINEAYMGFHRAITNNPSVFDDDWHKVLSRAKYDMFDYVRNTLGLRHAKKFDFMQQSFQQSFQKEEDREDVLFFEPIDEKDCFAEFEASDFLDNLFFKVRLTEDEWTIIQSYFYDEKPLKVVGHELGVSEAWASQKKKKMLKRLNEEAVMLME